MTPKASVSMLLIIHEKPVSHAQFTVGLQLLVLILKPEAVMCLNSREMIKWKCLHLITSHTPIAVYANLAITSKVTVKAMQSSASSWLPSIVGGRT